LNNFYNVAFLDLSSLRVKSHSLSLDEWIKPSYTATKVNVELRNVTNWCQLTR